MEISDWFNRVIFFQTFHGRIADLIEQLKKEIRYTLDKSDHIILLSFPTILCYGGNNPLSQKKVSISMTMRAFERYTKNSFAMEIHEWVRTKGQSIAHKRNDININGGERVN